MIKSRLIAVRARISFLLRFSGCAGLGVLLLASVAATPPATTSQGPDEQYIHIMSIIDRADALQATGQKEAARAKYRDAERALLMFKAANPLFFPKTIAYRLKEVTDQADTRPTLAEVTNSAATMNLEAEAAPAVKSNVKLLEPGAEPRAVLRYHVKPGDKQSAIMTWKTRSEIPMPAGGQPMAGQPAAGQPGAQGAGGTMVTSIPEISIPVDFAVQSVAVNGDVTYTAVMGEPSIAPDTNTPPEMMQQLQAAFAGLKGASSTWVKTARGATKRLDNKGITNTNLQARQVLDQFSESADIMNVELPEEAVGPGAKWEVKNNMKVQTATVGQTGTVELVSVDGDKLATKFDVNFEATTGAGKSAAAGTQISGGASGTVNVNLSKLVGSSSKLNMHMEIPMGRDKSQVAKIDVNIGLESQ